MAIPLLGRVGDPVHEKLVADLVNLYDYYETVLTTPFQTIVDYWRLFCGDQPDFRKRHELWRSNIFVPYPASAAQVKAAQISDLMNSADPLIQAGWGDEEKQKWAEAWFVYQNNANGFFPKSAQTWLDLFVQGSAVWKVGWIEKKAKVWQQWTQGKEAALQKAIEMAVQKGAPPPPSDPVGFENWRVLVGKAQMGDIPARETTGYTDVESYCGPGFKEVALTDLRFDPLVEDFQDQPVVFHRMFKPNSWVNEMVKRGIFDEEQVALSIGIGRERFNVWQEETAALMGLESSGEQNPIYMDASEVWEAHCPGTTYPYLVILNRSAVVNKTPWMTPFSGPFPHPYVWFKNVPLHGQAIGMSDYKLTKNLFLEMNKIRGLRIDAITLGVLPLLARTQGAGAIDLNLFLTPGMILPVPGRPSDTIGVVSKLDPNLQFAFNEEASLKVDIDESQGTQANVRGSTSTVGRVSATEQQARFEQAQKRNKEGASRIERYMQPYIDMSLWLAFQRYPEDIKKTLGGARDKMGMSPVSMPGQEYTKEDFLQMTKFDLQFRGASNALNRELAAQQLQGLITEGVNLRAIRPLEARALFSKVYQMLGFKNVEQILGDAGTQEITVLSQAEVAAAAMQKAQAEMQTAQMQAQAQQPQVDPNTGQPLLNPGEQPVPDSMPMGPNGAPPAALQ